MASPPRERPRLNLKPRDASAAAKAATDKAQSSRANPFGAAKPRESVLATRLGKDELAVLQEDLKKERINLRLKPEQVEEREQAEAGVAEIKTEIEQESDPDKKASLTAELNSRQEKLEALLENFQKLAVEQAKSGDTIRPSDRRRQLQEKMLQQGQQGGPPGQYGRGADFARGSSGGWGGGQSGAQPRDGGYGQGGGYQAGYNEGSYESSGSFGYGGGQSQNGQRSQGFDGAGPARRNSGGRGTGDGGFGSRGSNEAFPAGADFGRSGSRGGPGGEQDEYHSPYAGQDRF